MHSRFAPKDRNKIERERLGAKLPKVLVATQVIEVSLDIDFHQLFTEPAPIDALAQRMGRVNRSGKRKPARVAIMRDQVSTHKLYDSNRSRLTVEALELSHNPISEDALIKIADVVYGDGYVGAELEAFKQALNNPDLNDIERRWKAGVHQNWADDVFDEKDDRIDVLPAYYELEYDKMIKQGNWVEALSLLIALPASMILWRAKDSHFSSLIDTSHDPWIVRSPYDELRGLQLDSVEEIE